MRIPYSRDRQQIGSETAQTRAWRIPVFDEIFYYHETGPPYTEKNLNFSE